MDAGLCWEQQWQVLIPAPFGKQKDFRFHDRGLTEGAPGEGQRGRGMKAFPQSSSETDTEEDTNARPENTQASCLHVQYIPANHILYTIAKHLPKHSTVLNAHFLFFSIQNICLQ